MRFTPRLPDTNVNVSDTHPLVDLAWMAGGLAVIVVVVYAALGWAGQYAAVHLPQRYERWIGGRFGHGVGGEREDPDLGRRLDPLLAALPEDSPLHEYRFRVVVGDTEDVNAVAVPGGTIVVFRGLLEQVASENELAMVLAHELGHFAHRDHLRNLGRALGPLALTLALFGQDSAVTDLVSNLCGTLETKYSRQQESAADRFALDLLVAATGHAGGATDLFRRLAAKAGPRLPYLLASHPHPDDRIRAIEERIARMGYPIRPTVALGKGANSFHE